TSTRQILKEAHDEISKLGQQLWLWHESRRLKQHFAAAQDYGLSPENKCPETVPWKNCLLNLKSFGAGSMLGSQVFRYPRERLMNALALLLWEDDCLTRPELLMRLQQQLNSNSS